MENLSQLDGQQEPEPATGEPTPYTSDTIFIEAAANITNRVWSDPLRAQVEDFESDDEDQSEKDEDDDDGSFWGGVADPADLDMYDGLSAEQVLGESFECEAAGIGK